MMVNESLNDFSFWYPKVMNCGIRMPATYFKKLPAGDEADEKTLRLYQAFYHDHPDDDEIIKEWVEKSVLPDLEYYHLNGRIFVKNGRFSNKFDANNSCILVGTHRLAEAISNINYQALCCGADGIDEIVVRQFIPHDMATTPCIYNGLPLRSEFRVFYDFDKKKAIFTANYWEYDYVRPHLYEATDKIIFDHEWKRLEINFASNKIAVEKMVEAAMKNVSGLEGQWSVDILMDEKCQFWLIDMAVAQRSAYWDMRPDKVAYPE